MKSIREIAIVLCLLFLVGVMAATLWMSPSDDNEVKPAPLPTIPTLPKVEIKAVESLPQRPDGRLLPNVHPDEVKGVTFAPWGGMTLWRGARLAYTAGPAIDILQDWSDYGLTPTTTFTVDYGWGRVETVTFSGGEGLWEVSWRGLAIWIHSGHVSELENAPAGLISMSALEGDINEP